MSIQMIGPTIHMIHTLYIRYMGTPLYLGAGGENIFKITNVGQTLHEINNIFSLIVGSTSCISCI